MRERIVAFEEPCTRLTAAPSKEEENRSFLSHPPPPRYARSSYHGETVASAEHILEKR